MDLGSIKEMLDGFELGSLLPDLGTLLGKLEFAMRLLVLIGPLVMIIMGLLYLFAAPREANHHFGYRCYFGMGSEKAWLYTQRVAGITWTALGAALAMVMLFVSSAFAGQNAMDMVWSAVLCVLWQAGLILAATLVIRIIVAAKFNRHGERRQKN